MHAHTRMCPQAWMCTCTHTCMHTCAHTCMCKCTHAGTHAQAHAHAGTHAHARAHVRAPTCMHTCMHMRAHGALCAHACTHMYTHACAHVRMRRHARTGAGTHTHAHNSLQGRTVLGQRGASVPHVLVTFCFQTLLSLLEMLTFKVPRGTAGWHRAPHEPAQSSQGAERAVMLHKHKRLRERHARSRSLQGALAGRGLLADFLHKNLIFPPCHDRASFATHRTPCLLPVSCASPEPRAAS